MMTVIIVLMVCIMMMVMLMAVAMVMVIMSMMMVIFHGRDRVHDCGYGGRFLCLQRDDDGSVVVSRLHPQN